MTVIFSRAARDDLAAIYNYYAERDYEHAERLIHAILLACAALSDFPLMGKKGTLEGSRERLLRRYPYRIVYRIDGETIASSRILHQHQQWPPGSSDEGE